MLLLKKTTISKINCHKIGIDEEGNYPGGSSGKYQYVTAMLLKLNDSTLLEKGAIVANDFDSKEIRRILHGYTNNYGLKIKCETRRAIFQEIESLPFELNGKLDKIEFINLNFKVGDMLDFSDFYGLFGNKTSTPSVAKPSPLKAELIQHYVRNRDYTAEQVYLEKLEFLYASDEALLKIFVDALNPTIRQDEKEQLQLVEVLNKILIVSGFQFVEQEKGYYRAIASDTKSTQGIINIIFAQKKGVVKPKIVIDNALENKIKTIENANGWLVYDKKILDSLTIKELSDWWITQGYDGKLTARMEESLSDAEKKVFDTYYGLFCWKEKEYKYNFPALLPQIYLHYYPYTKEVFERNDDLPYQRMDFLMLINGYRIIIEVDDIKHYTDENKKGSSSKYAQMVAYDRKMKFEGYDIYRLGGSELIKSDYKKTLLAFFEELSKKYKFDYN